MPELATDISAVRLGVPDLAGDLFGSSLANMLILAIVVLVSGAGWHAARGDPRPRAHGLPGHRAERGRGRVHRGRPPRAARPVGPESVLLALGFLAGLRVVHAHAAHPPAEVQPPAVQHERPAGPTLSAARCSSLVSARWR